MSKKEATRLHILNTAFSLASRDGLDSLTIGQLAKASGMSKSGLFAHFQLTREFADCRPRLCRRTICRTGHSTSSFAYRA